MDCVWDIWISGAGVKKSLVIAPRCFFQWNVKYAYMEHVLIYIYWSDGIMHVPPLQLVKVLTILIIAWGFPRRGVGGNSQIRQTRASWIATLYPRCGNCVLSLSRHLSLELPYHSIVSRS